MNLEAMLTELDVAWPETPELTARVLVRLQAEPVPPPEGLTDLQVGYRRRSPMRLRRPLVVALAALLLMAATAAAVPGIRRPVLDWLGLRGVRIERIERPLPHAAGSGLGLGTHVRLADARRRIGFVPVLPAGLGAPVVYFDDYPPGGRLGLVYRGGTLFLVELVGTTNNEFLHKFVTPQTKLERVLVDGQRGLWIHGGLDQYVYVDRTGAIRPEQIRTAGKVLLWRRGKLLLRLEGARSKAEALRIARSLREAP